MIRKPNFKLNWKYALGELVLIFLGISLAIWFNNWNDDRKKMALEKSVLIQIYNEIGASLGDVTNDLSVLQQSMKSHFEVLDALNANEPYYDELAFHFHFMQTDEYTYPISTTYERIKLDGLEIITDDSLRFLIERLYEFSIPRIEKSESFHPDISEHYKPFYSKNFKPNTDLSLTFELFWADGDTARYPRPNRAPFRQEQETVGYVPLDFEQLKRSSEFRMLMSKELEYRHYKIRQYFRIVRDAEFIMSRIEGILGKENFR